MQIDLCKKIRISINTGSFLPRLTDVTAKYKEKSVLTALFQSPRGPAIKRLKQPTRFHFTK